MTKDLDLSTLSLDDLLEAVADRDTRPERAPDIVDKWATEQGYYPGSTKVPAAELYARFRKWAEEQGAPRIPVLATWGVSMGRRFKRGRSKHGNFYYISRESVVQIPPSLDAGGGGNPGGSGPGG